MPENLTAWKVKVWAMGHGTKVGQGEAEVVTKKDLLVRLQAPRFFVEKDEVVLSANVHNYLKTDKKVARRRSNSTAAPCRRHRLSQQKVEHRRRRREARRLARQGARPRAKPSSA